MQPESLLVGPRGRRLCFACVEGWRRRPWPERSGRGLDGVQFAAAVRAAIEDTDLAALAGETDPVAMLAPLAESTSHAMYWQEPDAWDVGLADPQLTEPLGPVAEAIARAPAARWWTTPAALDDQHTVSFHPDDSSRADLRARAAQPVSPDRLAEWTARALAEQARAESWPEDPTVNLTGFWWSIPAPGSFISSTRALPGNGPVGLSLEEDSADFRAADCRRLSVRPDASILEIHRPEDWVELTGRYPFDVSRARRHDWWRATGHVAEWTIPDYAAVAADYDAIHLSVLAYLMTAGRALAVGDRHSVLAGWEPDQTWWLTDAAQASGPTVSWQADESFDDLTHWVRAAGRARRRSVDRPEL